MGCCCSTLRLKNPFRARSSRPTPANTAPTPLTISAPTDAQHRTDFELPGLTPVENAMLQGVVIEGVAALEAVTSPLDVNRGGVGGGGYVEAATQVTEADLPTMPSPPLEQPRGLAALWSQDPKASTSASASRR